MRDRIEQRADAQRRRVRRFVAHRVRRDAPVPSPRSGRSGCRSRRATPFTSMPYISGAISVWLPCLDRQRRARLHRTPDSSDDGRSRGSAAAARAAGRAAPWPSPRGTRRRTIARPSAASANSTPPLSRNCRRLARSASVRLEIRRARKIEDRHLENRRIGQLHVGQFKRHGRAGQRVELVEQHRERRRARLPRPGVDHLAHAHLVGDLASALTSSTLLPTLLPASRMAVT